MKNIVRCFILITAFLCSVSGYSQRSSEELPRSFMAKDLSMNIPRMQMATADNELLKAEDRQDQDKSNPLRIGIFQSANYSMNNSGMTDLLQDGGTLWRLVIHSPGAFATSVVLSECHIPEGSDIYIYDPSRETIIGKYTSEMLEDQELLSDDLPGDELVIEYYQPADATFNGSFKISQIGHHYRNVFTTRGILGDADGNCHLNVACPEAQEWIDQINSVVCIRMDVTSGPNAGMYVCSGAMINNVRKDKTPYVLTAGHCYIPNSTYHFYFNYQTSTCDGTSGNYQSVRGGVTRAMDIKVTGSDFMLLEITGTISEAVRRDLYFAGWDNRENSPGTSVCIHHPGGDYKKISFPRLVFSANNIFWQVNWKTRQANQGTTEQGSSGSPLFNSRKRIVGDLCCGNSACSYPQGYDNFAKFSRSWTNNENPDPAQKLQPWLDPDNTGTKFMDGMYYNNQESKNKSVADSDIRKDFDIFPNPSPGQLTIEGDFINTHLQCKVYDLLGKLLYNETIANDSPISLELHDLESGVYFVEIIDGSISQKSKLIIGK